MDGNQTMTLQSRRPDLCDGPQCLAQRFACREDKWVGTQTLLEESQRCDPRNLCGTQKYTSERCREGLSSVPGKTLHHYPGKERFNNCICASITSTAQGGQSYISW